MTVTSEEVTGELLLTGDLDPARELALVLACGFHKHIDTDDPKTVVETAGDFLSFLTQDA